MSCSTSCGARIGSGPSRFRAARGGADQSLAKRIGADRCRQRAGDGSDRAVERQFAEHAEAFDRITGDRAHCRHQPERYGKIVMAALFRQIGRGEVDGDALRRQREPDRVQRAAHPLFAFSHRLVRQSDNGEVRQPRPDLHLDVDGARLDPLESDRRARANIA
jgi:hypothetical protein